VPASTMLMHLVQQNNLGTRSIALLTKCVAALLSRIVLSNSRCTLKSIRLYTLVFCLGVVIMLGLIRAACTLPRNLALGTLFVS
jgi:hypothetical protein